MILETKVVIKLGSAFRTVNLKTVGDTELKTGFFKNGHKNRLTGRFRNIQLLSICSLMIL